MVSVYSSTGLPKADAIVAIPMGTDGLQPFYSVLRWEDLEVDRFYLELWGSAIGKLVSFGGLGVWSILDIILIGTGYVGPADGSVYVY